MKRMIAFITLFATLNALALSQQTKDHLKALDQNSTSQWRASYLVDLSLEEFMQKTLSLVWGDERLGGHCFGVDDNEFDKYSREAQDAFEFDKYPESWRNMAQSFSNKIYKESKDFLGFDLQKAGKASSQFRTDVKGKYFIGCEASWEGSFGGGSSSIYISEDGKTSIGLISSWSE